MGEWISFLCYFSSFCPIFVKPNEYSILKMREGRREKEMETQRKTEGTGGGEETGVNESDNQLIRRLLFMLMCSSAAFRVVGRLILGVVEVSIALAAAVAAAVVVVVDVDVVVVLACSSHLPPASV